MPEPRRTVYDWLELDPERLWKHVRLTRTRSAGRGGRKIDTTSSTVILAFAPLDKVVQCRKYRFPEQNRTAALRNLRLAIALEASSPPPPEFLKRLAPYFRNGLHVQRRNPDWARVHAAVAGTLGALGGDLKGTASRLDVSRTRLSRFLRETGPALENANRIRRDAGFPPLRN
jgi:hypothetical protein